MGGKTMEALALIEAPSSSAKLVLLALAFCRDEKTGDCWPSREEIAAITSLGKTAIHEALVMLDDAGLISRFPRRDRRGLPASDGIVLREPEAANRKPVSGNKSLRIADDTDIRTPVSYKVSSTSAVPENGMLSRGGAVLDSDSSFKGRGEDRRKPRASRADSRFSKAAVEIWSVCPASPRARCRNDVGKVEYALRDAVADGADLDEIVAGARAYYAARTDDEGRAAYSPNVLIDKGYWRAEAPAERPSAAPPTPAQTATMTALEEQWEATRWGGPAGHHPIGTNEDPGALRQHRWLEVYFGRPADERDVFWDERQGPRPGQPGSRVWPGLLDRYLELNPRARG